MQKLSVSIITFRRMARLTMKNGKEKTKSIYTIIGPKVFFEGILSSREAIRIDGGFKGRIECESILVIGETGKVEGDIVAENLLVAGELIGNATAKNQLKIRQKGRLYGDICAEALVMEPGVIFEGKCHMNSPNRIPAFSEIDSPAAAAASA
ncbi:MAG: polymer-forming cytoskeletal protein [Deltaproteobacteria bacterium]